MPIYEYQCPDCDNIFEEWTKSANDEEEKTCPKCQGAAHRMISNTAFILKGGGWYVTDYGYRKGVHEESKSSGTVKSSGESSSSTSDSSSSAAAAATPAPAAAPASSPAPAAG